MYKAPSVSAHRSCSVRWLFSYFPSCETVVSDTGHSCPEWAGRGGEGILPVFNGRRLGGDGGGGLNIDLMEILDSSSTFSKAFNKIILNSTTMGAFLFPSFLAVGLLERCGFIHIKSGSVEAEALDRLPDEAT